MKYAKIVLFQPGAQINDFAKARNNLLAKAKEEWVLFLDTDEKISEELNNEIPIAIGMTKFNGFYLKRDDFFFGRWLKFGETANVKLLRLARKGSGLWKNPVHEIWEINGPVGELKNPLLHYSHKNIQSFIAKINYYTNLTPKEKFNYLKLFGFPTGKFMQNYLLRLGLLDGLAGFVMAYMMSLQSLITRVKCYDFSQTIPVIG